MIYLENKTLLQDVYIPRQDMLPYTTGSGGTYAEGYDDGVNDQKAKLASTAFTENGDYQRNDGWSAITVNVPQSGSVLEGKEVVVSQDVTIVVPTSGYDGFSAVTVDATEYGQTNYDSGFDDGYTDGYSSGSSEGYDSGYTEGYQSGSTDGYNSGYTSGETHQKSLLVSTSITQNGSYSRENGYSSITVNVPQTGSTAVLGVGSFSANGTYSASTDNFDGYSAITVNVPHTAYTIEDTKAVNVSFTNTPIVVTPTKNNIQVTEITPNKKFSLNASSLRGINHYLYLGCFRDISINDRYAGNSVIYNGYNFNVDTKYSDYPFTATTEGGGTILTIEFLYSTFEWIGNGDGSDYDLLSATTICFKPDVSARDVFVDMSSYVQSIYAVNYGLDYLKGVVVSCENLVNSARTEAQNAIISTFTATTATTNGVYGSSASPLSSITVNVPQTGHTDQEMDDAYDSGYTSGYTDGYDSGYTSGQTDGLNSGYTEGYNSGYTEGQNDVISTFSSITITQNGQYGDSVHPMSSITVNVPQSGYSINDLALRNYTINNPSITASTIEESAFEGCSGLTGNLELGSSVWTIKQGAFCGSSISEIIWPQSIDGGAFSVTSMTMRDGCQFAECQNIEYVEVPSYVTFSSVTINASSGMFYNCQNLVNVDYYASRIPTRCFDGCIGLEYIYIDNITSIGQKAFYGCTHLTSIRFAQQNPPTVSNSDAFSYVPSGGTLYVPFGRSSAYQSYLNYLTNWTIVEDAE